MKLIPVFKNVNWNNNYSDVPKFWNNVDKELWLLKKYCNNNDKTVWDQLLNVKSIKRENNIRGSVVFDLKLLPTNYGKQDIYFLLKCNYLVSNSGQFYFVVNAKVNNLNSIIFTLELDSWMTNIEPIIVNDSIEKNVIQGQHDRFIDKDTNNVSFDYSDENCNWNYTHADNFNYIVQTKWLLKIDNFFNKNTRKDFSLIGKEAYDILNEYPCFIALVPYDTALKSQTGSKMNEENLITSTEENVKIEIPYRILVSPVRPSGLVQLQANYGGQTSGDVSLETEALLKVTNASSKTIGVGFFQGVSLGWSWVSPTTGATDIFKIDFTQTSTNTKLRIDMGNGGQPVKDNTSKGSEYTMGVSHLTQQDKDNKTVFKIMEKDDATNITSWVFKNRPILPAVKAIENFESENWWDVFTPKLIRKQELNKNNLKNIKYETYMYNEKLTKITLKTFSSQKQLSYFLLQGEKPSLTATNFWNEGQLFISRRLNVGRYKQSIYAGDFLSETINIIFPTTSDKAVDYMVQNQAQHKVERTQGIFNAAFGAITGAVGIAASVFIPGAVSRSTGFVSGVVGGGQGASGAFGIRKADAKVEDLQARPNETSNTQNNVLGSLNTSIMDFFDYIIYEKPKASELKQVYDDVYENGVSWNKRQIINWDSRYWFNYWIIQDVIKTLDNSNLSPFEYGFTNDLFGRGLRMWHIREQEQDFIPNNFTRENVEKWVT